jgi:aerobic carbon-monoxide dehydrogenase large subunit
LIDVGTALVGSSVTRREDTRILTGHGRYVGDIQRHGLLHACFVRSSVAHARIAGIDTAAAASLPWVVAVITGVDLRAGTRPLDFHVPGIDGLTTPAYHALSVDRVRHVGDPVALVVARSRYVAEDAADLVILDLEPLPPVTSAREAVADGAPLLFDGVPDNRMFSGVTISGDVDRAFAVADEVVQFSLSGKRRAPAPIETRGGVASYDLSSGGLTYETSCQSPHALRLIVGLTTGQPLHLVRVIARDVGGSFGLKWSPTREDVALCAVAKLLRASIKWIEDRRENLTVWGHARDDALEVELAVRSDGTILGLRADITLDQGAYPMMPSAFTTAGLIRVMLPGPYRIPAYRATECVVLTNKAPCGALRGPWGIETLVRERLLDVVARRRRISPVDMRRRNLVPSDEQPYRSCAGYDLIDATAEKTFDRALEIADYDSVEEVLAAERAAGKIVGFGVATFIEPAPGTPAMWRAISGLPFLGETARVAIEPNGHVSLHTQQMPHGQGHETTLAQVCAGELGVALEDVSVVYGDTAATPFGLAGTSGSRAGMLATGAARLATQTLKGKILAVAAPMLGADPADLVIREGRISSVDDPDTGVALADLAMGCYLAPDTVPPGLDLDLQATATYDGEGGGFSQATHCCWVEVSPDTGIVHIRRYLTVDDCGTIINPAVVEGQIRGAIAMGIGGVLYEEVVHTGAGECVTGSLGDYLLPTATEVPEIEIEHLDQDPEQPIRFRGVGEGGTILAPAAILNAIDDAVGSAGGAPLTEALVTPTRMLEVLGVIASDD